MFCFLYQFDFLQLLYTPFFNNFNMEKINHNEERRGDIKYDILYSLEYREKGEAMNEDNTESGVIISSRK